MGYALCMAPCFGCKQVFSFNPLRVPSIRHNDVRQPICRTCIELANPKRIANGLPPIEILPDAYDPIDEREL